MTKRIRARISGVKGYVNAMRPTWLSNPFKPEDYDNREECLIDYEQYLQDKLQHDEQFAARFDQLHGRDIGCTCWPLNKPCHVDVIIKLLNERKNRFYVCKYCKKSIDIKLYGLKFLNTRTREYECLTCARDGQWNRKK